MHEFYYSSVISDSRALAVCTVSENVCRQKTVKFVLKQRQG